MLGVGSGLVFQSKSHAKSPMQRVTTIKVKKFDININKTDEGTELHLYHKRKSLLEGELDQSSETGSMHMMAVTEKPFQRQLRNSPTIKQAFSTY